MVFVAQGQNMSLSPLANPKSVGVGLRLGARNTGFWQRGREGFEGVARATHCMQPIYMRFRMLFIHCMRCAGT